MKNRPFLVIITVCIMFFWGCEKENNYPSSLFIYPEAFTPNSDFLNDYWGPVGGLSDLDTDSSVVWHAGVNLNTYDMKIRNKNGRKLFYSQDINLCWDGTFKSDTCAPGFYYYLVRYESLEGVKYRDEGVLELIR